MNFLKAYYVVTELLLSARSPFARAFACPNYLLRSTTTGASHNHDLTPFTRFFTSTKLMPSHVLRLTTSQTTPTDDVEIVEELGLDLDLIGNLVVDEVIHYENRVLTDSSSIESSSSVSTAIDGNLRMNQSNSDDNSNSSSNNNNSRSINNSNTGTKGQSSNNNNNNNNPALSALKRAVEIGTILGGNVAAPILISLASREEWPDGWDAFWDTRTPNYMKTTIRSPSKNNIANGAEGMISSGTQNRGKNMANGITHAQRLALALEMLGPTYVKFGQALGSRPDVIPPSLAEALRGLQDDMTRFDEEVAKRIVWEELSSRVMMGEHDGDERGENDVSESNNVGAEGDGQQVTLEKLEVLLSSMTEVAAASIGQVYKAHLPGLGDVAVKVQRPGVRLLVERDAELLLTIAKFLESLPALPSTSTSLSSATTSITVNNTSTSSKPTRLINTRLVAATQEFMSRIFEELDYRHEAANIVTFSNLYSHNNGSSKDVKVVVPKVYLEWCTENVLVMEWIEGTKLTDVQTKAGGRTDDPPSAPSFTNAENASQSEEDIRKENLELVKVAIDSTLSQLLITGILHADPHAGNLLKIRLPSGKVTLGYLDFGLLSTIPQQVRDALVCSVALQVFSRDVEAVACLFGELQLIPQWVLEEEGERRALVEALDSTFENSLRYPEEEEGEVEEEEEESLSIATTRIPELKFDKLLDSLSRLVPRFRFDLPPYFINNARALSTLEGIAKSLDPSFNVLNIMYPYALNRLLRNPSRSPVVAKTLQSLIRSKVEYGEEYGGAGTGGRIDRQKIRRLLQDSALISGVSKRRIVWDVLKTREGRRLAIDILREEASHYFSVRSIQSRGSLSRDAVDGRRQRRRRRRKKWYYFES